jgi:hypothetical protein
MKPFIYASPCTHVCPPDSLRSRLFKVSVDPTKVLKGPYLGKAKSKAKVDPAETRTPDQSTFRKEYEPGSNKNRIGRKSSARRSDPARLHSSRHLGWAMVGDAKSRKCKKAILQRIRSGRRGAQPTSAHSSPQPAQATHHVAQAQRRRQRFDLKHRK